MLKLILSRPMHMGPGEGAAATVSKSSMISHDAGRSLSPTTVRPAERPRYRSLVRARAAASDCDRPQLHHGIIIVIIEIDDLIALSIDSGRESEQRAGCAGIDLERLADETAGQYRGDLNQQVGRGARCADADVGVGDQQIAVLQQGGA